MLTETCGTFLCSQGAKVDQPGREIRCFLEMWQEELIIDGEKPSLISRGTQKLIPNTVTVLNEKVETLKLLEENGKIWPERCLI